MISLQINPLETIEFHIKSMIIVIISNNTYLTFKLFYIL
jgi:hypothetical protein